MFPCSVSPLCQPQTSGHLFHNGSASQSLHRRLAKRLRCHANEKQKASTGTVLDERPKESEGASPGFSLGDVLGPIGLTFSGLIQPKVAAGSEVEEKTESPTQNSSGDRTPAAARSEAPTASASPSGAVPSIHSLSTEEWRRLYEADGYVDLWVEEEFNAGSRIMGGRDAYKGDSPGAGSGEGPSRGTAAVHRVRIINHHAGQDVQVEVPEDRYILWEAEEQGLLLPFACRMGCCTACAVRVKEGQMYQPQSLGVSAELRERGYALMCVGFPLTDLVLETVEEDEVYDLQFGSVFAKQALDPADPRYIDPDPFALEIANMDE